MVFRPLTKGMHLKKGLKGRHARNCNVLKVPTTHHNRRPSTEVLRSRPSAPVGPLQWPVHALAAVEGGR
jgi:hypothetical protein